MTQSVGRHTSLTFATALRPGGALWLRALFWAARHIRAVAAPLKPIDVIHFARWTLLDHLGSRRLESPVLLFESDFDRDLEAYIETFAETLGIRMRAVWSTSYGNPGLVPTDRFHDWVTRHELTPGHFYSAFPEATSARIGAALQLAERLESFAAATIELDDEAFALAYRAFLSDVQRWL